MIIIPMDAIGLLLVQVHVAQIKLKMCIHGLPETEVKAILVKLIMGNVFPHLPHGFLCHHQGWQVRVLEHRNIPLYHIPKPVGKAVIGRFLSVGHRLVPALFIPDPLQKTRLSPFTQMLPLLVQTIFASEKLTPPAIGSHPHMPIPGY